MTMERLKNAALVLCLFIVLVVIFSSYFRASEVGTRSTCGNHSFNPRLQSTGSEVGHSGPAKGHNSANRRSTRL
jgi:hypothetical protein